MFLYTASTYSVCVKDLFEEVKVFYVHSIFQNGFHLEGNGRLIFIGNAQKGRPPFGIGIPPFVLQSLQKGITLSEKVQYQDTEQALIFSDGTTLSLRGAEEYSPQVKNERRSPETLSKMLKLFETKSDFILENGQLGLPYEETLMKVPELQAFMLNPQDINVLDYWIGRGAGLTPSGDDILVGMLLVFRFAGYLKSADVVYQYVEDHGANRTTAISCEYLYYAVRGFFSKELSDLLFAILAEEEIEPILRQILAVGHTSGTDTLFGIHMALKKLMEELNESK